MINASCQTAEWEAALPRFSDCMPEAQLLIRPDFTILHANPECDRLFGFPRGSLVSKNLKELVASTSWEGLAACWTQFLTGEHEKRERCGPIAISGRRCGGKRFPAEAILVRFAPRDTTGLMTIVREFAEQKRYALHSMLQRVRIRQARELARLKDQFLSVISHEIKTPLSVILGQSELLQEYYPGEGGFDVIADSVMALSEKIQSILDYSALVSGSLPLYRTELGIGEIAGMAIDSVSDAFRTKGQTLRISIERPTSAVFGDQRRLVQALVAVLDNARKFSPPQSTVTFRVALAQTCAVFEIADTGPGMTRRQIELAADPFRNGGRRAPGEVGGLGLGLAIVHRVMALHGGDVTIESRPARGAHVTLKLPLLLP